MHSDTRLVPLEVFVANLALKHGRLGLQLFVLLNILATGHLMSLLNVGSDVLGTKVQFPAYLAPVFAAFIPVHKGEKGKDYAIDRWHF